MTGTRNAARIIIVMGVSGAGKSTFGGTLAGRLQAAFIEADDLHPQANLQMMAAGRPLGDAERWPWLEAVAAATQKRMKEGAPIVVIACSALRRRYRDFLRERVGPAFFVHLDGDAALLRNRMAERRGHFMPATMLDSQLATLEQLEPDEDGMVLDIALDGDAMLRRALAALDAAFGAGMPT